MRPEATELRIFVEPRHKVVRHCRDCVITTKSLVQRFVLLAHRRSFLLLN